MAKKKNLSWERVSSHGMQAGSYRVGKVFLDGCTLYELFHDWTLLKICADFHQAQEIAQQHSEGKWDGD